MTVEQVLKSARELSRHEKIELLQRLEVEIDADEAEASHSEVDGPDGLLAAFAAFAEQLDEAGVELPSDGAAQHDHYIYGTSKT